MKSFFERIKQMFARKSALPNHEIGMFVAKSFLVRALQISFGHLVYIKGWRHVISTFSDYREDARGGKGYFEMRVFVTFQTSSSTTAVHSAYALLHVACESREYEWKPNHCGSYICIDGEKYFEILCDFLSENVEFGKEGFGSHIPESFRKEVAEFPWGKLSQF